MPNRETDLLMGKVAVVKYCAGNIQSVFFALNRLGVDPVWTDDAHALRAADKVIFPGVGEAGSAMECLRKTGLDSVIPSLTQPLLGICLSLFSRFTIPLHRRGTVLWNT